MHLIPLLRAHVQSTGSDWYFTDAQLRSCFAALRRNIYGYAPVLPSATTLAHQGAIEQKEANDVAKKKIEVGKPEDPDVIRATLRAKHEKAEKERLDAKRRAMFDAKKAAKPNDEKQKKKR